MSFTGRLLGIRAASSGTGNDRPTRGGSAGVMYSAPGVPQIPEWDGLTAVRNGYLASLYVMRCARKTAEKLASFPFRAGDDPDKPASYNPVSPLSQLLGPATGASPGGPNPQWSARQFWIWSIIQRLISGKMAWETVTVQPRGVGNVVALWPLVAPFVMPVPSGAKRDSLGFPYAGQSPYDLTAPGSPRYFDGYEYQLPTGRIQYVPDEVFYSWRQAQLDPRQPESVLQAAALPVSLQIGLERYLWALAKNGMVGKTLIVTPPFEEEHEEEAFRSQFLSEFTGYDNAGKTMFATIDDDADVNARISSGGAAQRTSVQALKMDNSPTDAQALGLLQAMYEQIRVAFGMPKSKLVDATQSTYANAEQDDLNWTLDEIIPLGQEIADDINTRLAPRLGSDVGWFDFSRALKPRGVFAPIAPDNALKAGLITRNDWRGDVGLEELSDQEDAAAPVEVTAGSDAGSGSSGARAATSDKPTGLIAAGLAVKALDTGRVLMLQRAMSDDDPASGTWEFPGGKLEPDEDPFAAAVREWQEEVGCALPQGRVAGTWTSPNGVYRGFVYLIAQETLVTCNLDHEDRHVLNPDDPDGDQIEVVAWWNPAQLPAMSALRPEARKGTDWHLIATAGNERAALLECGHRAGTCTGLGPCDTTPFGAGHNWVNRAGGLPPYIRAVAHAFRRNGLSESESIERAVGVVRNWAEGKGGVTAQTKARAVKAIAQWEALKAKAKTMSGARGDVPGHEFHGNQWTHLLGDVFNGQHDHMDAIRAVKITGHARITGAGPRERALAEAIRHRVSTEGVNAAVHTVAVDGHHYTRVFDTARHSHTRDALTETGSAAALLPKAPMPTVVTRAHMFMPSQANRRKCGVDGCGLSVSAKVHGLNRRSAGERHAGADGHHRVPTGHLARARRQTLTQVHGQADNLEPAIHRAMTGLFEQQRKATLSRLKGRRGQSMLRAATPPPPPDDSAQHPGQQAPLMDAGQVFDMAHWVAKTRTALDPVLGAVVSMTADRFAGHLGELAAADSLGAVQQVLDTRLQRLAEQLSQTTFDEIATVLRQGVIGGQTVAQMTSELEQVFTDAEQNRAATIARTESIGALNEAAATYADNLPADVVAGREWLSAHDSRVRETHRVADGQVQPMGQPYLVGGVPMLFPHDPAAPPDEVINCRCTQAFLTPAEYAQRTQPATVAA